MMRRHNCPTCDCVVLQRVSLEEKLARRGSAAVVASDVPTSLLRTPPPMPPPMASRTLFNPNVRSLKLLPTTLLPLCYVCCHCRGFMSTHLLSMAPNNRNSTSCRRTTVTLTKDGISLHTSAAIGRHDEYE